MANKFLNFLDMFDGGGRGQTGAQFEGGLLSELGNALFRPAGYADREEERLAGIRPRTRPQRVGRVREAPAAPVPAPYFDDYLRQNQMSAPYAGDYFGVAQLPMQSNIQPEGISQIQEVLDNPFYERYDPLQSYQNEVSQRPVQSSAQLSSPVVNSDPDFEKFLEGYKYDPYFDPNNESHMNTLYNLYTTMGR